MQQRPSRRSVLAGAGTLALAGLAGCTSGDSESATTDEPTATTTETTDTTADETTAESDAPAVDWSEVAAFRTWLADYSTLPGSNRRFDYQGVGLDRVVGTGRASFLELAADDIEGFLVQSGNSIYLGEFDADALTDRIEDSPDHEVTDEYAGYTTAAAAETDTEFAVGEDAVLAGSELSVWIDARRGERERLEEVDPVFTRIFERLPDREVVTAQYGAPAGGEIDADGIEAWGNSMPSVEPESATWVYALDADATEAEIDELEAELAASAFTGEVTERRVDGRFVTFSATVALPE